MKRMPIDAKNADSHDVPDNDDNNTLTSLHTKADEVEEDGTFKKKYMLHNLPPMRRTSINDESTIFSNITMDNQMETVESDIGNLDNPVNHMVHMLTKNIQEMRQGISIAPAKFQ